MENKDCKCVLVLIQVAGEGGGHGNQDLVTSCLQIAC